MEGGFVVTLYTTSALYDFVEQLERDEQIYVF
jgi:uncharacterized protein with GYD domain